MKKLGKRSPSTFSSIEAFRCSSCESLCIASCGCAGDEGWRIPRTDSRDVVVHNSRRK